MYLKKINLKNKVALVTGAGKGIGRACSIALAEAGATTIGVSRTAYKTTRLLSGECIWTFPAVFKRRAGMLVK